MQLSFWEYDSFFSRLDAVIIGGGIVGLSTALSLKELRPRWRIAVLERSIWPYGASTRNAGFACFGSPGELLADLEYHSEEEVFGLVEKRWKGLLRLRTRLGDRNINYQNLGGYEVFDSEEAYELCRQKLDYLNQQVKPIVGSSIYREADDDITRFGFSRVKHLLLNTAEGQINTGRMMRALLQLTHRKGIQVFSGLGAEKLVEESHTVTIHTTAGFPINTPRVISATNAFAGQLLPELEVIPGRAQLFITHPVPGLKLKGTFHYDHGYYYFRNVGDRILFGGGRNLDLKAEETTEFGLTEPVQNRLDHLLQTLIAPYTSPVVDLRWSGIMGLGPQKTPLIKALSPRIVCAVRMGGMGIAIGSLVGDEAAALTAEL